jgi:hypothetical protein
MAKKKFDGVIQAVHYQADGQIAWVRAYLRRGPTYSDLVLLDRKTLIEQLKTGKRYYSGQRVLQLASTFDLDEPLQLLEKDGKQILVVGNRVAERDLLAGVPVV